MTKPNTSAAITERAEAFREKARDSNIASNYITNASPEKSPERSLIKGAAHRRLQSLQPGNVKDLRSYLDGARAPERSPERGRSSTPMGRDDEKDYLGGSPDKASRSGTPTPTARDPFERTPSLRPPTRASYKAILGENTPPSATMLALQTMPVRDYPNEPPFQNITNGAA
ncbi:hypothetical protein LTS18_003253, partial [Coniosporium uncinatum]